jgi:glycosyltransferase involved in cell wall biosynthesis
MSATGPQARLAVFVPSFRGGGAERVMLALARGFAGRGVAVDVAVAQNVGPNVPAADELFRVVDLRAGRALAALPGLARYLRREAPAVMLSALPHANVIAVWARALARASTRIVVSEHTTPSLSAALGTHRGARLLPYFMRRSYPKADAVVAVSDGVADDTAAFLHVERTAITRIYNPIVSGRLEALAAEPLDQPWFAPAAPPVVLGVGRLTAAKDFGTLIRAFAELRKRRAARLLILGEGEERGPLTALARELRVHEDVALPGFDDNPFRYMRRAGAFVLSSRWEGLGNALVEAMACGAPVVSTDCPNGPREILEGGRHGRLVPVGDYAALAGAIEACLAGPAPPTAIQRAGAFSVEAALDRYAGVLGI